MGCTAGTYSLFLHANAKALSGSMDTWRNSGGTRAQAAPAQSQAAVPVTSVGDDGLRAVAAGAGTSTTELEEDQVGVKELSGMSPCMSTF